MKKLGIYIVATASCFFLLVWIQNYILRYLWMIFLRLKRMLKHT